MKIAVFAAAVALVGCVTTEPQSIGRDTYMVETMGSNLSYGPVLRKANVFCAKQGKKVQVVSQDKGGVMVSANTTLKFMCLDESDPRYGAR